jgi:peptidoglycan/xylan/chitin deacetylase (PgdA/CDA1 family)
MIDNIYQLNSPLSKAFNRVILNHQEISSIEDTHLINFGSHTQTHQRLTNTVEQHILEKEVINSKNNLVDLTHKYLDIFCFPNGDTCLKAEKQVKKHYNGACTTQKGVNHPDCDHYKLKRFNFHNGNSGSNRRFFSALL